MALLFLISIISIIFQIMIMTVSIAAGLYYIAELVEEYTVIAKKVITIAILFDTTLYLLFVVVDDLPWSMIICGLASQICYFFILKDFPFFTLASVQFIGASILLALNHYLSISYFSSQPFVISEILGYFTICLWAVPFGFIVSLNVNDNVLPTHAEKSTPMTNNDSDTVLHYFSNKNKTGSLLSLFKYAKESMFSSQGKKSF